MGALLILGGRSDIGGELALRQCAGQEDALALPARELLDLLVHVLGQVQVLQDLGDALGPLLLGHVLGEAQLSGVLEGLADSEAE